jgi:type II secretory pathway component PulF
MKYDEFAFFNQQLAAMLRDGIPLEGALKRLCEDMHAGKLRDELRAFETDLARGTPVAEALKPRQLPELYKRMVLVGVKSGDLPGALTMLADYFQRQSDIWTRLRSMMTYPLIVMGAGFLISILIAVLWNFIIGPAFRDMYSGFEMRLPGATQFALDSLQAIWAFPLVLGILFLVALSIVFQPAMRGKILWRLPAFKEANVARVASALTLLLKNGVSLPDAIGLVEGLEDNKRANADLRRWKEKLATGVAKFSEIASASRMFPPMFVWIVAGAGEDLISGFRRAADMYQSRAIYRTEVALFSVLPVASLFLGAVVISQAFLVFSMFLPMFVMIGNLT